MKLLHYNDTLVIPALKLLDLYSSLWECYVIKSAEKMQFEDKQRQLLESNEWLASDSDILLQPCGSLIIRYWYFGIKSEQFRPFVTVWFQLFKRAIFKPTH